ncbi:RnfABCDGE type electron transport complex subunit D [Ectothiorhodospira lacustris]|uniref:RnfABCDGE type electron transport complex subunit D n=1 Tax=Ectothiorhodospira lacustris TaxID=2899127 RepID=UPI001EE83C32|nr:RnfABCDGE type electron transport complex subunit D [Ectothiorhodospira lacustris]MCG5509533.1 RnfABCDGE type electron transport complex subunit D [Ectothiorhodospira lacustris]MCG5521672.1 RnfABCDGE type electron transport complex subunit D [Ectothiorhodospira lacustris]
MTPLKIELKTSPHLKQAGSVEQIMRHVTYALLPICAFSVYHFGISALALMITATVTCVLTEHLFAKLSGKRTSVSDFSAVITGLLLALTLPPSFPLWMAALSGFIGISLAKVMFGGMGYNLFNPALVGRAFAQAAFPVSVSTWTVPGHPDRFTEFLPSTLAMPFTTPAPVDAWTAATPLAQWKFDGIHADAWSLFTGMTPGSVGETSAILILLCGLYLIARGMMNWRIPAAVLGSAFVTASVFYWMDPAFYPTPWFVLLSGGLMLGAMFMASDMVASPITRSGIWIYGILIGFLAVIIRFFGGLPEGIMYAILLGNAVAPLIERITQPRPYGSRKRRDAA